MLMNNGGRKSVSYAKGAVKDETIVEEYKLA